MFLLELPLHFNALASWLPLFHPLRKAIQEETDSTCKVGKSFTKKTKGEDKPIKNNTLLLLRSAKNLEILGSTLVDDILAYLTP